MTLSGAPGSGERYPGETLELLRAVNVQLGELLTMRDDFGPLLDSLRDGKGLLGMARAARRQNGARDDHSAHGAPSDAPGPGAGIGPGLWGRARGARHAASGDPSAGGGQQ